MKSIIKKLFYKLFSKNPTYQMIEKYEYISFDIFDTIIKRNVLDEKDIFQIVELKYNQKYTDKISNFKYERINAEKIARNKTEEEEITMDEIYKELNFEDETKNILMNIEIETELNLCTSNPYMKKIYNECRKNNKKIIFTSDMYLPEKIIRRILEKNDYEFDFLFLSSTYLKRKKNYSLFLEILNNLNISKKQIVHIGDNIKSDYVVPNMNGIKAILIKKECYNYSIKVKDKSLTYSIISATANNSINKNDNVYKLLGNAILGPLLLGYVKYINKYITENNLNKMFFLARDGKIIMEAYKLMFPNSLQEIYYLNVSRKSIIYASLYKISEYKEFNKIIKPLMRRNASVEDVLINFDLDVKKYEKNLYEKNILLNYKYFYLSNEKLKDCFNLIKNEIYIKSKNQNKLLIKYLKEQFFEGKVCIIDIGWRGTIQKLLNDICKDYIDVNIVGLYYGIRNNNVGFAKGYIYEGEKSLEFNEINYSIGLFETLFLTCEGSTIGYELCNNKVLPKLKSVEHNKEEIINLSTLHLSALDYIRKLVSLNVDSILSDDYKDYFKNYEMIAVNPNLDYLKKLENITFLDDKIIKLIECKNFGYYLFHPVKFKEDLENTHYKIGFLKKIFKIRLNYCKILEIIKKIDREDRT